MASTLRISLFGPLRVERDGRPLPDRAWRSRQERRLLGALVAARGATIPLSRLTEWLWPGADQDSAAVTLRSAVSSLRRMLDPGARRASGRYIETRHGGYGWSREVDAWVDLDEFLGCLDPPEHPPSESDLARAVALYRGNLLEDELDAPWVITTRELARERFLRAAEDLVERRMARGEYADAAAIARRALDADPLREPLCRALMRVLALEGDVAAALQYYERFRLLLDHELGASPSPATQALHAAILRGEIEAGAGARERVAEPSSPEMLPRMPIARQPIARTLPPLVGRDSELAQLRGWVAALDRRQGAVIALVGEAGIGKTRLLAELARIAEGRGAQPIMLRCTPMEQSLPFAALAEALRPLARAAPESLLRHLPRASLAQLAELIPALREQAPGLPDLPPLPPDEARTRLVEGVAELGLALARLTPLVVCCDDAQWADEAVLATIGRLARHTAGRPLLLVIAYRPEELTDSPALHALLRSLGHEMLLRPLLLGPLEEDAGAELIAGPVTSRSPRLDRLARRLAAQAGGNPLLMSVAHQTLLELHGARSLAALPYDLDLDAPLPDLSGAAAIREMVGARVERLAEPVRTLLDQLAVVGRPVPLDLVEQLGGAHALEDAQSLLDRQLLAEVDSERLAFAHEVLRATLLAMLGLPRRRLIHRQVATALIGLYGADPAYAAEISAHLAEAGRGYETDLLHYALIAAEQAMIAHTPRVALGWYDTALAAATRSGQQADPQLRDRAIAGRHAVLLALGGDRGGPLALSEKPIRPSNED